MLLCLFLYRHYIHDPAFKKVKDFLDSGISHDFFFKVFPPNTGKVEQILAFTLGGGYSAAPKEKPVCECTDHSHAQVRAAIREQHLTSIRDAMHFLEWKTPDGCPKCRPALNLYLVATWPGEAVDDPLARVHNERVHANIQQDGTYSVVPRCLGGLTNAKELRVVAEIAERHGVPVKITGGQRLAIPFIKKEDLPKVWKELADNDMMSGFAYGKAVRSVKSCILSSMPVAFNALIPPSTYNLDLDLANSCWFFTTALLLFVLPLLFLIVNWF